MTCPACGAPVPEGARFCPECGQRLIAAADERRLATVLMADLVGFTALSAGSDPEQVKRLVDACFEALVADIVDFGGRLDKIVGDEIVALFGAPVAHEDDAERAVRAALRMQETLACARAAIWASGSQMRVGVNTGEVLVGAMRAGGDPTAMGDVVNTAQRLEKLAEPGQVIVGPATDAATRDVDPLRGARAAGAAGTRGAGRVVPRYRGARTSRAAARPGASARSSAATPSSRRSSRSSQWPTRRRRAHLVLLSGEAGVGKSRLASELGVRAARDFGAAVLTGQCVPYGDANVFVAVAEALRQRVRLRRPGGETDIDAAAHVTETRRQPAGARDRCRRDRTHGRGAPLPDRRRHPARRRSHARPRRRAALDDRVLRSACVERPLGPHALRPALGERRSPRALRPAARPLARPAVRARRHDRAPASKTAGPRRRASTTSSRCSSIRSTASPPPSSCARCSCGDADDETVEFLLERSGGNPFFVEELVAFMQESGDSDRLHELPATLHGLVAARLDALDPAERSLLEDCAIVGASGSDRRPSSRSPTRSDGRRLLDSLAERDFLVVEHDDFHFKSELIREIAYGTLTKAERARRHAVVAPVLAARGEHAVDQAAHHLATAAELVAELGTVDGVPADVRAQAIDTLMRAAERDESVESWLLAERHHDRALALLGSENTEARRTALLGRAHAAVHRRVLDDAARRHARGPDAKRAPPTTGPAKPIALTLLGEGEAATGAYDVAEETFGAGLDPVARARRRVGCGRRAPRARHVASVPRRSRAGRAVRVRGARLVPFLRQSTRRGVGAAEPRVDLVLARQHPARREPARGVGRLVRRARRLGRAQLGLRAARVRALQPGPARRSRGASPSTSRSKAARPAIAGRSA